MYSSIYRVQSSTRRLPIRALFGFTLKQSSPIPPLPSESLSVVVHPRFTLGRLIQGFDYFIKYDHKVLCHWGYCFCRLYTHTRGITLGDSKWGIGSDLRDHIVPDELGDFDPFSPVVLSIIDISPKVLVDFAIQLLCLPVSLGMKCSGHLSFNAQ